MQAIGIHLSSTGLEVLLASDNKCGDKACLTIAEHLRCSKSVHTLNLASNYLTDTAGKALSHALQGNSSLKSLILSGNLMTNQSAETFTNALNYNKTLTHICIDNNRCISFYHIDKLQLLTERNKQQQNAKLIPELREKLNEFNAKKKINPNKLQRMFKELLDEKLKA